MRGSIPVSATGEGQSGNGWPSSPPSLMATNVALTHARASAPLARRLTAAEEVVKFVRTKPLGAAGAVIILGMMGVAMFAELLAPFDPYRADYGLQFARPTAEHWFGTDEF